MAGCEDVFEFESVPPTAAELEAHLADALGPSWAPGDVEYLVEGNQVRLLSFVGARDLRYGRGFLLSRGGRHHFELSSPAQPLTPASSVMSPKPWRDLRWWERIRVGLGL
jgi:hypothetical protein